MRRVVCAAMQSGDVVVLSPRHWDAIAHEAIRRLGPSAHLQPWAPGFVDQHGIFMDPYTAWRVATIAHQIIRRVPGDNSNLQSENLY